ncbi:MAG: biopolymer transporter ExbD [Verrucomicrobiales bacterium]|nr:biopolymer transporter ExbD [Verrucomicrobiales bacterium]
MAGGGGGGEGEPEFQIAPMIDVLLTLLIFFMSITTSQVEKVDRDIKLPVAPDAKERKPDGKQAIINVKWNPSDQKSTITFDSKPYEDMEELKTALEAKRGARTDLEILIRGDRDLPAKEIQKIMQAAGMAGIDSLAYSTYNQ